MDFHKRSILNRERQFADMHTEKQRDFRYSAPHLILMKQMCLSKIGKLLLSAIVVGGEKYRYIKIQTL